MPFDILTKFGRDTTPKTDVPADHVKPDTCDTLSCVIKSRRSVRKYQKKDVSSQVIQWIMEAARNAPSAGNYQPWEFIVVKSEDIKKDIVSASYNQNWMMDAPVMIVACVNMRLASAVYGERGSRLYGIQSVAAAIENIILMAQALELGTCWVGAFSEVVISRLLECPDYVRPCAIITLGYPAEETKTPTKQSIQEFVHMEKFGNTMQDTYVIVEKKPTYMKFQ
jgi:nitroreductase